jgi:ATP-dependent RNA helicase HelY
VLEKLSKWNGETHADITAGEYTQLTGRAGRRGIDVEGHAVVLWTPGFDPTHLAGLAGTRTYPLRSSFSPTYNMATNLVAQVGRADARGLLEQSFAQFQADRAVVGLARQVAQSEEALGGYREAATCHLGDVTAYDGIRRALSARESELARAGAASRRAAAAASLEKLRPGDVVQLPNTRRGGVAVVIRAEHDGPTVVTAERQVRRLTAAEIPHPLTPIGSVRIPKAFNVRSPHARRDLVSALRAAGFLDAPRGPRPPKRNADDDEEILRLRSALRAHPVHGCSDRAEHLRWLVRAEALEKETAQLRSRVDARSGGIARTFDRVCAVLDQLGYLDGDTVTDAGRRLSRIYGEADLVVTACLDAKTWSGLDAPALAAVVSTLVYEPRRDEPPVHAPPAPSRDAIAATQRMWAELAEVESSHRLDTLRRPDPGLAWAVHRWASGATLDAVLSGAEILPGDFVRWCKQLMDLLGQIASADAGEVSSTAGRAADAVRRGVVAYA